MTVDEAYAECRRIAHKHGANFSVGFRFLPRVKRRAVYAAYAWCRWADDIADESPGGDVNARLDDVLLKPRQEAPKFLDFHAAAPHLAGKLDA